MQNSNTGQSGSGQSGTNQSGSNRPSGNQSGSNQQTQSDGGGLPAQQGGGAARSAADSQRPVGGETLARAAQGAHRAVDATVQKVAPVIDAVHDKVEAAKGAAQGVKDVALNAQGQAGAAKDQVAEWIGAAREAIRENPFAAVAGALLVGVAYASMKRR